MLLIMWYEVLFYRRPQHYTTVIDKSRAPRNFPVTPTKFVHTRYYCLLLWSISPSILGQLDANLQILQIIPSKSQVSPNPIRKSISFLYFYGGKKQKPSPTKKEHHICRHFFKARIFNFRHTKHKQTLVNPVHAPKPTQNSWYLLLLWLQTG